MPSESAAKTSGLNARQPAYGITQVDRTPKEDESYLNRLPGSSNQPAPRSSVVNQPPNFNPSLLRGRQTFLSADASHLPSNSEHQRSFDVSPQPANSQPSLQDFHTPATSSVSTVSLESELSAASAQNPGNASDCSLGSAQLTSRTETLTPSSVPTPVAPQAPVFTSQESPDNRGVTPPIPEAQQVPGRKGIATPNSNQRLLGDKISSTNALEDNIPASGPGFSVPATPSFRPIHKSSGSSPLRSGTDRIEDLDAKWSLSPGNYRSSQILELGQAVPMDGKNLDEAREIQIRRARDSILSMNDVLSDFDLQRGKVRSHSRKNSQTVDQWATSVGHRRDISSASTIPQLAHAQAIAMNQVEVPMHTHVSSPTVGPQTQTNTSQHTQLPHDITEDDINPLIDADKELAKERQELSSDQLPAMPGAFPSPLRSSGDTQSENQFGRIQPLQRYQAVQPLQSPQVTRSYLPPHQQYGLDHPRAGSDQVGFQRPSRPPTRPPVIDSGGKVTSPRASEMFVTAAEYSSDEGLISNLGRSSLDPGIDRASFQTNTATQGGTSSSSRFSGDYGEISRAMEEALTRTPLPLQGGNVLDQNSLELTYPGVPYESGFTQNMDNELSHMYHPTASSPTGTQYGTPRGTILQPAAELREPRLPTKSESLNKLAQLLSEEDDMTFSSSINHSHHPLPASPPAGLNLQDSRMTEMGAPTEGAPKGVEELFSSRQSLQPTPPHFTEPLNNSKDSAGLDSRSPLTHHSTAPPNHPKRGASLWDSSLRSAYRINPSDASKARGKAYEGKKQTKSLSVVNLSPGKDESLSEFTQTPSRHRKALSEPHKPARHSNSGRRRNFTKKSIENMMDQKPSLYDFEDINLPGPERVLLERFVDTLSKLSVEVQMDEGKRQEGRRRLNNALRALEGWI